MGSSKQPHLLPVDVLLCQYVRRRESGSTLGNVAIRDARDTWLAESFLDTADDGTLGRVASAFYAAVQPVPFHPPVAGRRVRLLRHALNHLVRGHDPLADRLGRCITPGEVYAIAGLGPTFWTAVAKALDPTVVPHWCPATEAGLRRMFPSRSTDNRFTAMEAGHAAIRALVPAMDADAVDDFLDRVGRMTGREWLTTPSTDRTAWAWGPQAVADALRRVRSRHPLRKRLREAGDADGRLLAALAGPADSRQNGFWEAVRDRHGGDDLDRVVGAVDDGWPTATSDDEKAALWWELVGVFRERFRAHPLEVVDILREVVGDRPPTARVDAGETFGGFCADTFEFLGELAAHNSREWMDNEGGRYRYVLREPLVELCRSVAARYVEPVLNREYGWDLESGATTGKSLTSICKNDFGRGDPYQPVQWVTYYRRSQASKRADAQFFVRVAADGVGYGFHLGRTARDAGRQFRANIQDHADALYSALAAGGVFDDYTFWADDGHAQPVAVKSPADLRAWAANKSLAAGRRRPPTDALLRRDELAGEILLTFDRLLPLFACAAEADPLPVLRRRAGSADGRPPFDRAAFHRETLLSDVWVDRVRGLLELKKQLILQGVPGTGKTHVAQALARLLAHDRGDCVRLVQFHPGYSYEEFVEGIKARTIDADGRGAISYPVEDGVLCAFAEQATKRPSEPHVLVIDEINRGNLPRIFGELLYLLEYRDREVTLPYSRRPFRLPDNLLVLATMNTADRSAVALDQALRRRFSFVDMPPDAALLAGWLDAHPPAAADETFGPRVVRAFEELNRRLARDLGPDRQVGHTFFMVPELDAAKLSAVWDHHVRPLLLDHLGGRDERLGPYTFDKLMGERKGKRPTTATDEASA